MTAQVLRAALALLLWLAAACALAQDVELVASVDRTEPRFNESFTYVLRAEGRVRGQPDVTPLLELFDVLSSSESTRIQIVNGRAEQVIEWIYQLMPKQAGKALIPPIEVAGTFSNAVEIDVLPATAQGDAPGDIFLEVEVSPERAYVQSQIIYTLRLFVGTMTGRATITPPRITGGEAIVERLGDDREYRASRAGRDFTVRERRFAIFPQQAGALTIGPTTFEAMVIPPRGFSRVQRFESEPVELEVLPAVPPPASHPNAAWLPARRLELWEGWGTAPDDLVVGVPTTRTLTIEAEGLLETQLPELDVPGAASGVRMYADRPELDRTVTGDGLVARRVERYAVLPQTAGETTLPGIELPWFDTVNGRWQIASIPSLVLDVQPGAAAADPVPQQPTESETQLAPSAAPPVPESNPWPLVSAVLGAAWAVTLLLWWRSSRSRGAVERVEPKAPKRPSVRGAAKRLHAACAANDAPAARTALLDWAAERFPGDSPRSLGALAARLPDDAAAAVLELEAALYSRGARTWDGAGLAAAVESHDGNARRRQRRAEDPLLPLYR